MQSLKIVVLTTAFLLFFHSLSSAEMTGMSLQERMRQSDAVVVGTVQELHQADAGVGGQFPPPVSHWLATCRVERYITHKIHNAEAEDLKRVNTIRIAFVQIPTQKPSPLKLTEGRKYLLFLKEISAQGERLYEMITPYHGAFEAGQDYFVHDEQSPGYPKTVKMSFEEIVRRVTPQNPALPKPADPAVAPQPLTLTIQADKKVYGVGEDVGLTLEFKNVSTQNVWLLKKIFPSADLQLWLYKIDGEKRELVPLPMPIDVLMPIPAENDFKELLPWEVFFIQITLKDFQQELILQKGSYEMSLELNLPSYIFPPHLKITLWMGKAMSNTISIEIVQRVAPQDQASCEAQGGRWGRFGLMAKDQCNLPTADAGKECRDHGECEGNCVTNDSIPAGTEVTGRCYKWTIARGTCLNGVKDGKAQGMICVD
ncbi:MAG: hypothetical protein A3D87_02110 [Omnitrophica WOR_2 bacterium RIFCSPHIGHO2_02_FULL_50_17]|nr:MAG: hypothetical protein A3D87_02110 [Omnitrophica WOR_2 bacterium RIFCSPHIGHO2_02_FULL_50_17]